MAEKTGILDGAMGLAQSTPWGAGIKAISDIASTPNTSASGDVNAGQHAFGDINFGFTGRSISPLVWLGVFALAAIWLARR